MPHLTRFLNELLDECAFSTVSMQSDGMYVADSFINVKCSYE